MSTMDATDKFIEMVESICKYRSMYTCGGSFLEVCAYVSGFAHSSTSCPLGNDGWKAFSRYVARHFGFPENYIWPYVLKTCSRDDDEATERLRSLLLQFSNSARTQSYQEILDSIRPQVVPKEDAEPEQTMRKLLAALMTGSRNEIEPLIMDHPDAEILWQGSYPAEVARQLSHISNSHPIGRVSDHADDGQVRLITADFPFPIRVTKLGQQWKVDAEEIIAIRKQARELRG
jgi:hypothetical protein